MDVLFQSLEEAIGISKIYISIAKDLINRTLSATDFKLRDAQPSYVILGTIIALYATISMIKFLTDIYKNASIANILRFVRSLPIVRNYVKKELDKIGKDLKDDLSKVYNSEKFLISLPKRATSPEVLLKKVKHYQMFDTSNWQQGRISGAVYGTNSSHFDGILLSVFGSYLWSNPLHADVFAGVRRMEAEIIRMVATMFGGDPDKVVGSVTSGGTESIFMACKAYRDYAIKVRGVKGQPEFIAPRTAHAAFEKAANILNCKIIHTPVDAKTFKVDIKAMKRAITSNTCMLVGSAPQFPHGIIDPISEIAKLGLKYKIPVHVDACLGGFLIAFMKQAGHDLDELFDFSVRGVTSISCDTHKYGYAPKGTSVILYSDKEFIHYQYSIQTDWPGGIYASPTLPGSRPGALIATCWAAMMYHGLDGYVAATDQVIKTTKWIRSELSDVKGLKLLGNPMVSVLAFGSDELDIYALNGALKDLGWNLNVLQFPSAFHLCVTLMHTGNSVAASFVRDVKFVCKDLMSKPKTRAKGAAAIYGMAQTIPDRSIVSELCTKYLDACLGH